MPQVINNEESSRTGVRPNGAATNTLKESLEAGETHYALLGVQEEATNEELKAAFRQMALHEHPDKGGDADRFHELEMAWNVLQNKERRDAYDAELEKERERAALVEGAPLRKVREAPARVKTAPTDGSKRSKKIAGQGGSEWKLHGSGIGIMKMIEDGADVEAKAEVLFTKYAVLPRHKEKKRDWLKGVMGDEKKQLKMAAKAAEKAQMEKCQKWLAGPTEKAQKVDKRFTGKALAKVTPSPPVDTAGVTVGEVDQPTAAATA